MSMQKKKKTKPRWIIKEDIDYIFELLEGCGRACTVASSSGSWAD